MAVRPAYIGIRSCLNVLPRRRCPNIVNISVVVPVKWDVLQRLLVICELKEFCMPLAAHTKKKAASGTGEVDK